MSASPSQDALKTLLSDWPSFHMGGMWHLSSLPQTLTAIDAAVKPGDRTIETGVGASTVIFTARGDEHTAISPNPDEHQRVRDYCDRIGVDHSRLNFVAALSDDVLPEMLGRERTLDVAFIDGAHCFPFPAVDWHYMARALKIGGILFMDDAPIPAAGDIFRHMQREPNWQLQGIHDGRSASFRLTAEPGAGDDWEDQPYNRGDPDFSFVPLPGRVHAEVDFRVDRLRHGLGERYPALGRVRRRARSWIDR